ncbi:MAG: hypothetical protein COA78_22515 [Blastopirellula sp.]|nr:MAG: hypothetical protein COA78_22515 [Blastopirellula sp.]
MLYRFCLLAVCSLGLISISKAEEASLDSLKPIMVQPGSVVIQSDFSKAGVANKADWAPRQGTRWAIEDGVLRGRPSSAEYQAKKADHKGYEPRMSVPKTPAEFMAKFSIRFTDGSTTAIVPFIEFGHHVARVRFTAQGTQLLADHEIMLVAEAKDFEYEPGRWYHALAEMKGDEFVIQFADGPTLYAKHPLFAEAATSGASGFGTAGPKGGLVEIDNMAIYEVKPSVQKTWSQSRLKFPKFTPVQVKEPKVKKAKK